MITSSSEDEGPEAVEQRRIVRLEENYMEPALFRERFRLTQSQTEELLRVIGRRLRPQTFRRNALSSKQKILPALRFYASGCFYYIDGDAQGACKASVCRALRQVMQEINAALFENINWPARTDDCQAMAYGFYRIAKVHSICGAIDGTLIPIKAIYTIYLPESTAYAVQDV